MTVNRLQDNARLLILTAAVFFTGMAACIKAVSPEIPLAETIFFRSAISAMILSFLLRHRGIPFRAKNFPLLVTRSLAGLVAMSCNFYALGHLSFGDAAMLVNTFPVFVAILSFLFLGERPTKGLLALIAVSLAGILLILHPQLNFLNFAGLIALLSAVFSGVVVVVIHQSHETDPFLRIAFYFTGASALVSGPVMLPYFITPAPFQTLLLIAAGLLGTAGQIVMTKAYGMEDVSRLAPLAYFGVVLSFFLGILFWGEIPNLWSIAGSGIVILSCIQIARLEKPAPVMD